MDISSLYDFYDVHEQKEKFAKAMSFMIGHPQTEIVLPSLKTWGDVYCDRFRYKNLMGLRMTQLEDF